MKSNFQDSREYELGSWSFWALNITTSRWTLCSSYPGIHDLVKLQVSIILFVTRNRPKFNLSSRVFQLFLYSEELQCCFLLSYRIRRDIFKNSLLWCPWVSSRHGGFCLRFLYSDTIIQWSDFVSDGTENYLSFVSPVTSLILCLKHCSLISFSTIKQLQQLSA